MKKFERKYYQGLSPLPERFLHAFRGLANVWKREPNFKIEALFALAVLAAMIILPLSGTEMAVLVLIIALVLSLEIVNSIVEQVLDAWHPQLSEKTKRIKDTMAGAVFLASFTSVVIGGLILLQPIVAFDRRVRGFIEYIQTPQILNVAEILTMLGGWKVIVPLTLITGAILTVRKKYKLLSLLFGSVFVGQAIVWILKIFLGRARPSDMEVSIGANGFSFPSGHVFMITVFLLSLGYIANKYLVKGKTKTIWFFVGLIILTVALTRVVLSVHWISDVFGGALLGLFWFLLWFGLNERFFES